jgi:hypothetical protein
MTKRQLIDEIVVLNQTAKPAFLAKFNDGALSDYLHHLLQSRRPRLFGDSHRYDKYFVKDTPAPVSQRHTAVEETVAAESAAITVSETPQPLPAEETVAAHLEPAARVAEPVVADVQEDVAADGNAEEAGESTDLTYGYTFLPSVHSHDDEDDSEDLGISPADDHADEQRETVSASLAAGDQDRPKDSNDTWLF